MKAKDVEFYNRVVQLEKYISATNFRLKRIYKFTAPKINLFWQDVWDELGQYDKESDIKVEVLVEERIKHLNKGSKKKREVIDEIVSDSNPG
jgi:hypothetical protein